MPISPQPRDPQTHQARRLSLFAAAFAVLAILPPNRSFAADDAAQPAARSLDLALLVADVPASRPFVAPGTRLSTTTTAGSRETAVTTAASAALFAAVPFPSPASLPATPTSGTPAPLTTTTTSTTSTTTAGTVTTIPPVSAPGVASGPGILLNFQNASLGDVLNYLSSAAGFVIVQEQPVTGTVNLVSRQPITADEAVDLLNAVLIEKGFIALRSGRILKIVPRANAEKRDLPVIQGSDPAQIPRRDNMVTQILPVRYAEVAKLVDSLRPLLSEQAVITSNDSSNAILLTDTQTNIHRIAEIVRALDTSISGISALKIFSLRYADSKAIADIITQLFSPTTATNGQNGRGNNNQGGFPGFPNFGNFGGRGGQGGQGGRGGQPAAPDSEARQAASRVVAVADEQSNSVVVAAPDEFMPNISEVVSRLDTNVADVSETRIFRLVYADATELAGLLSSLYSDMDSSSSGSGASGRTGQNGRNGGGGMQQQFQQFLQRQNDSRSDRALLQSRVVAVPDPRTNSVLVSASHVTMEQIALTVGRLDATDARKQHVYVHTLTHADPDNVAAILRGMYSLDNSGQSQQPSTSRLSNRTTTGASSDIADTLNTNSSRTGTGR